MPRISRPALVLVALASATTACRDASHRAVEVDAGVDAAIELPPNARAALAKPDGTTKADHAVAEAQDAVRRDLGKHDAWVTLGNAWIERARESGDRASYVNADACASVLLAKDPDDVAAAGLRGAVLLARGDYAEARSAAERTTSTHPADAVAWGQLVDALVALGRYEEANDALTKLLALGPSLASARRASYLAWLRGDVALAKKTLREAPGFDGDADALVDAAKIAWHEGDYATAEARFDDALARAPEPGFAPALVGKGRVAMARKELGRAAELLARAYAKDHSAETAWLLGDAREAADDAKGAHAAYEIVRNARASDPRAYSLFISTRTDSTKLERDQAVELASQEHVKRIDVYTEDALAWALYRAGMIEPAKSTMARARRLRTPDARILFHEGAIRIAGGDVKKGKEVIAKALAMNPAFDWRGAEEARALLH